MSASSQGTETVSKPDVGASKKLIKNAGKLIADFEKKASAIDENIKQLNASKAALDTKSADIEAKYGRIVDIYNDLFDDSGDAICTKDAIKGFEAEIRSTHTASKILESEINEIHRGVLGYDTSIRNYNNIEEQKGKGIPIQKDDKEKEYWIDTKHTEGIDDQIRSQYQEILAMREKEEKCFSEQAAKTTTRCEELFSEITKLFPGATSSGLTAAYEDARKTHEAIVKKWEWIFSGIVIALAAVPAYILIPKLSEIFKDGVIDLKMLLGRMAVIVTVELPLIWFGFMASKIGNQHRRISEEYRHKWTVAYSFLGMRTQVEEIFEEEQSKLLLDLLSNMVSTHADNPSHIITDNKNYDHPLMCLIERVRLASFLKSSGIKNMDELVGAASNTLKTIISSAILSTIDTKNSDGGSEKSEKKA